MANFEVFLYSIKLSINLLFLKSDMILFIESIKLHYHKLTISIEMHQDYCRDFYLTFLYFCVSYTKKLASIQNTK